jgi:phosphatidylglycerophosphate synthase
MKNLKFLIAVLYRWYIEEPRIDPRYYNKIKTWPNLITAIGLVAGVGNLVLVSYTSWGAVSFLSLVLLLVAGISDLADGFCARKTGQRSKFGEWFDPARDIVYIIALINQFSKLKGWEIFFHPSLMNVYRVEALIIAAGVFIGMYFGIQTHKAGKIRRAIHAVVLFMVISLEIFGVSSDHALPFLFSAMACASCAALWFYAKLNWQNIQLLLSSESPCLIVRVARSSIALLL